jgi:putative ABC transport system permease protein
MILNYLKTVFRNIFRNKVYSLINILGLSVGLAAVLLIFLFVHNEFQYDKFLNDRGSIFRVESSLNHAEQPSLVGNILMNENTYCDKVARVHLSDQNFTYKNNGYLINNTALADPSFFDIFNFEFIHGNPKEALKVLNSLVLTNSIAYKIFGNENPLGKTILFENTYPFTITGVIKDPTYFHLQFNCIGTLGSWRNIRYQEVLEQFDGWSYFTYIKCKAGISDSMLQQKVNNKLMEYDYKYFVKFKITSLNKLYLNKPLDGENPTIHGNKTLIRILISIALLILIIACINFINISTARATARAKEIGIRKTIGAKRFQLVVQFIFETLIIVLVSLMMAITIVELIQPYFCSLVGKNIDFRIIYTYWFAPIILCFSIIISILAGIYPAFYLSRHKPTAVLKGKLSFKTKSSFLKNALIVFQYVTAIVLISSTIIIYKQLIYLKNINLGFNKDHLVYIKINDEIIKNQDAFKAQILNIPGVLKASYSGNIMGTEWGNWQNDIGDKQRLNFKSNVIDPDYFETMGIEVSAGRNFRKEDEDNTDFIINEKAISKYDMQNVIGTRVVRGDKPGNIIGVVSDVHYLSPRDKVLPTIFYYNKKHIRVVNLKLHRTNIQSTLKKIQNIWEETCPAFAFEYQFADEAYDKQYRSDELAGSLIGIGSLLAIIIACLGIYGLAISSSENRTKEIGIRKVNGAKISEILFLLNKDFVKLVAIAFVIACPIIWIATNMWLQSFANKTEISWWIFALAGSVAFIIAIGTVSGQAWRAARRNPEEALRSE